QLTLDAEGRVVQRERIGTGSSGIVVEETTYDAAGRIIQTKDAAGKPTAYAYSYPSGGGEITTITYPDGGTRIETTYADGRPKEISGTAVNPTKYEYGVWAEGEWTKEIKVGENGAESEWAKTYTNALNQTVKIEYADSSFATMTYDDRG